MYQRAAGQKWLIIGRNGFSALLLHSIPFTNFWQEGKICGWGGEGGGGGTRFGVQQGEGQERPDVVLQDHSFVVTAAVQARHKMSHSRQETGCGQGRGGQQRLAQNVSGPF